MIGAPAVVDAVRVTQEAADVSEAVRLLQSGADNQRILMAVGLEEEADTLAAEAFLAQVHHAASEIAKPILPEPMPMLLNAQEQRELEEIQRILALSSSDYRNGAGPLLGPETPGERRSLDPHTWDFQQLAHTASRMV